MWFEKFLSVIDRSFVGEAVARRVDLIKSTDPENIYVENIRSFFHVPHGVAKFLCDVAVREGVFEKRVGYLCPKDKNIIQYATENEEDVEVVACYICEAMGEDEYEFAPSDLQRIEVYSVSAS